MSDLLRKFQQKMMSERDLEISILQQFHRAINKEEPRDSSEVGKAHTPHVTAVIYKCTRKIYYDTVSPVKIINLPGAIRTWVGRELHKTQLLSRGEMELNLLWEENGKTLLKGRLDEFDGRVLLDKKTTRHTPRQAYDHHFRQTEIYNFLLNKSKQRSAEYAAIAYINIQDAEIKVFVQRLKGNFEEIEKELRPKLDAVFFAQKTGILPPRVIEQWSDGSVGTVCSYCNSYGRCWEEDDIDKLRWQTIKASMNLGEEKIDEGLTNVVADDAPAEEN